MIVYTDLLEEIASERRHIFISTGMSTYEDIQTAIDIFKGANCPFELMHTVSTYPMKDENANLNVIKTLQERFDCNVLDTAVMRLAWQFSMQQRQWVFLH